MLTKAQNKPTTLMDEACEKHGERVSELWPGVFLCATCFHNYHGVTSAPLTPPLHTLHSAVLQDQMNEST